MRIKKMLHSFFEGNRSSRIEVFVRHCHYSSASAHKARFPAFSKERCFQNLMGTIDRKRANVTFLLDAFHPSDRDHFLRSQDHYPVIEIKAGAEGESFLKMIEYVLQQNFRPETPIYFLEDDYIHREGWVDILLEGLSLPGIEYVTLYDHRDKYFSTHYSDLQSKIFHTTSCHWRTTPSTTNTYAMRFKTLLKHLDVHCEFSKGKQITADHDKFCRLHEMGALLISSIPGWATHAEPEFASPCVDWESILSQSSNV